MGASAHALGQPGRRVGGKGPRSEPAAARERAGGGGAVARSERGQGSSAHAAAHRARARQPPGLHPPPTQDPVGRGGGSGGGCLAGGCCASAAKRRDSAKELGAVARSRSKLGRHPPDRSRAEPVARDPGSSNERHAASGGRAGQSAGRVAGPGRSAWRRRRRRNSSR